MSRQRQGRRVRPVQVPHAAEPQDEVKLPLHFGTLALTLVGTAVLLALAPVLPWAVGLLSVALALTGLAKAGNPGRLRLWPGWWGPRMGLFDGVALMVCAFMPLSMAAAVIWVGMGG